MRTFALLQKKPVIDHDDEEDEYHRIISLDAKSNGSLNSDSKSEVYTFTSNQLKSEYSSRSQRHASFSEDETIASSNV